ncbi:hypothetical protein SAMN04490248_108126 [Salinihabitans flavidus]|uniref:Uncharacterized protein n=1 Tax=Salinihabitans flavidus TaxID=569882 RepID=A0A1H8REW9_9RHOB|nr:hypothetical protein [Salinihabitans flavidus]SEO64906.1 hypothetical protein SAMN04490248_108126 [Salinihabitans flavidus]
MNFSQNPITLSMNHLALMSQMMERHLRLNTALTRTMWRLAVPTTEQTRQPPATQAPKPAARKKPAAKRRKPASTAKSAQKPAPVASTASAPNTAQTAKPDPAPARKPTTQAAKSAPAPKPTAPAAKPDPAPAAKPTAQAAPVPKAETAGDSDKPRRARAPSKPPAMPDSTAPKSASQNSGSKA